CTAGGLAHRLTETPGSSDWFEYGFVTYANRAKVDLLGVSPETLDRHGAVSAPVVRQMAIGACRRADADFALSISGIAGPSGGTADKPVGTVDFGLATPEGVYRRRYEFSARSREYVRRASIDTALSLLIWHVDEKLDRHGIDGPTPVDEVRSDH
ncbi:MAG: CinA family protein, partial [Bradymonadaceae bacterium]